MQMWRSDMWTQHIGGRIERLGWACIHCAKQTAIGKLLYSTGSSAQCSDDLDGGMGVEVQTWGGKYTYN